MGIEEKLSQARSLANLTTVAIVVALIGHLFTHLFGDMCGRLAKTKQAYIIGEINGCQPFWDLGCAHKRCPTTRMSRLSPH